MCPVCITSMVLTAAGATWTGGLTALIVTKLHAKISAKKINLTTRIRGEQNESINRKQDRSPESCISR
jgi:hypothetical protein